MKPKILLTSCFFTVAGITGWIVGGFGGGALFGAALLLLIVYTVGKYLAEKAQAKMDDFNTNIINLKNDYRDGNK
jgi:hypothetical protein